MGRDAFVAGNNAGLLLLDLVGAYSIHYLEHKSKMAVGSFI